MGMPKIISNFNTNHAPKLITCMLMVNILIFVRGLFPIFELGMPALMLGLGMMAALLKINDEPLADFLGKRVGAMFAKNYLISLISLFVITVGHQLLLLWYSWL